MHDYRERLYVPVSWWLLAVPVVLVLGAYSYLVLRGAWPLVVIGAFAVAATALLLSLGSTHVEITGNQLHVGGQTLPLAKVTEVIPLDAEQTAKLRGPASDPAARLYSRPYLKQSVYLALAQGAQGAEGAVPYWLIGTRHPAELAAQIDNCRTGQEHVA